MHRIFQWCSKRGFSAIPLVVLGAIAPLAIAAPAWAQPNQSDHSGTNPNEPPITKPDIEYNGPDLPLDVTVLEYAQRLSDELERARIVCAESRQVAAAAPRRFARGAAPLVCVNPECERLEVITEQARTFLDNLDRAQIEQLQRVRTLTLW